jgi:hypothetical protein
MTGGRSDRELIPTIFLKTLLPLPASKKKKYHCIMLMLNNKAFGPNLKTAFLTTIKVAI